ncbi:Hypothetical predicted protein [Mytilus galloprovincialis]|uniref:ZP domain-containing protein n=1 Tax=Mytilus galloprovincialis TaxID=29158 RepID=A0A8B6HQK6_MYTGA|nr:Hypothetical predicted protein [Mytilus galloprovincialis]
MALSTTFILSLMFCTITLTVAATTKGTKPPTGVTATATTPPPMEFSCVNGKVDDIKGTSIDLTAVVVDLENGKMCHISPPNCTWQNMYSKLHVIYDKRETHAKLVAGHPYYYELECKSGYVANASAVPFKIESTSPSFIHRDFKPTVNPGVLTIELHKGNKILTKAENVFIGDLLSLKIIGPGQVVISPISCTATATNNKYLLWDNTDCKSKDEAIMVDNWTTGNKSISINMYAFRFVDSSSVTIECSTYICPSSDAACLKEVKTCSGKTSNGRKRRSSNIESNPLKKYKEETSSVSFSVADRFGGTNGSEGVFGNILLYLTALITIVFLGRE